MMSRKHYESVANMVARLDATLSDPTQAPDIAVRDHADDLADLFADDNPAFDRDRFIRACGFGS